MSYKQLRLKIEQCDVFLGDVAVALIRLVLRPRSLAVSLSLMAVIKQPAERLLLRKEVIQPQVTLRLPCYDFIPVTNHTLGVSLL